MQRKFLFNLILLIAVNLLVKPLAIFGIDAEVQNRIGYADFGIYYALFNFTTIFNIFLDLGITNFNIKNVAQFPILSKKYIGKLFSIRFLLFALYAILIFAIGIGIGFRGNQLNILLFLVINQFLLSLILFFRSYLSGMLYFVLDTFFSVFDKFLLIFFCGYFLYIDRTAPFTIYDFIFSQTFAYLISITCAVLVLRKKIGFQSFRIQKHFSIAIFKQAFPYALLILLMTFYTRTDAVLLERIHPQGAAETGLYAQAYRILDAFVMFAMLFNTLLFPIFSRQLATKENIQPLLVNASKLIFTLSISVAVGCFYFSADILHLFYTNLKPESVTVFKILILAFIPISGIQVFGTLHTAAGNLRFLNYVSALGIVVSVVFNIIVIPKYGAIGTAAVCILTNLVILVIQLIYTKSYFHFRIAWKTICAFLGFLILLCFSVSVLQHTGKGFFFNLGIFVATTFVFAILFRLLDWQNIRLLLASTVSRKK